MSVFGALVLTLSTATPASSMFVIVPDVLAEAGSGALIAMAIAAVIAVFMAQVYAELASAFPHAGGEYAMSGLTLGPLTGFVALGLNLTNTLFGTAALALGVGTYLSAAIPGPSPIPTGLATVAVATLLGVLNIRTGALITGVFVAVELLALVILAALGFAHPARGVAGLLAHPLTLSGGAMHPALPAAIGAAVAVSIFAYDGYGAAAYFSEETRSARRSVARAILLALSVTGAAEAIPLVAVLVGAPDLQALLAAKAPFAEFIAARGGAALAQGMSLAVALAIVNAVIATLLLSARQLYASGRDRTWGGPLNRLFTRLHPRLGSPWAATLVVGALVGSLCFLGLKLLLIATGTGAAGIYAILCVAALRGRRTGATRSAVYRMPLFPWIPILTLIALGGVFVSDALDAEEGRPGLAVSLSVAVAFAAYYLVRAGQKGGWTPTVVEEAADDGDPITAQEITPLPARSLQPFFSDGREDA
jgi:amino acid transporter